MPKVLISDSLDNIASEILIKNNISVDTKTNLSSEELKKIIDNYDGLIIRSATKVRKDLIDSLSNLKIIGRAGAGVDNVDVEAAKNKNIIVMNTPGGNTNATAEHTIGLIFALQRKITVANETTHKGLWEKKEIKRK
jgi:D-3-phosphoglycerate dehydrogenase